MPQSSTISRTVIFSNDFLPTRRKKDSIIAFLVKDGTRSPLSFAPVLYIVYQKAAKLARLFLKILFALPQKHLEIQKIMCYTINNINFVSSIFLMRGNYEAYFYLQSCSRKRQ